MEDKYLKIKMALVVVREFAPAWLVKADADDLISRRLVKFIEKQPTNTAWYSEKGSEVLQRAVQLDLHTTARMRSSVLDLARSHRCPAAATRYWLRRTGVTQ